MTDHLPLFWNPDQKKGDYPVLHKKTPLDKEWKSMRNKEVRFLKKRSAQEESFLNRQLADKVPEKLQTALDMAFEKAFTLIFEKGTSVIDKTFSKENLKATYQMNEFADSIKQNRKSLHSFTRKAQGSGTKNLLISGAAGIGMGLVGAGLPDIPVLTAMILKSIYEIALSYGYDYETEQEQAFILMLIQGAVSTGDTMRMMDERINELILKEQLPCDYSRELQIRNTAACLSKELLYMKFIQGIPVVGVIGGAYDIVYLKLITEYANIKYRRRFLIQKKNIFQKNKERYYISD